MKRNISKEERIVRALIGLILLAEPRIEFIIIAAYAFITAVLAFCPIYWLLKKDFSKS